VDAGVLFLGETRSRAFVIGLALVIVGAGITLRGARDQRSGGEATAHPYGPPPFHAWSKEARDSRLP